MNIFLFAFYSYLLFLSMFFISSPYSCLSYHFFTLLFGLLFGFLLCLLVLSLLFSLCQAFYSSFPSFLLFAYLCLCINQSLYIYFLAFFFVLSYNLQNISIIYIYLNYYLCFYFLMLFCRSLLFLAVFYSCLYVDLFVALFSMKSLFFLCLISFIILYNKHSYCFNLYFPLIIRILCFYIFA